DCIEYAADVESAGNEEAAVVPVGKLACGEVCYSAAEDDSVLNGDVEHVGSLPDRRIIAPCASCTWLSLRNRQRYYQQVKGPVKEHRLVIRQGWRVTTPISNRVVARINRMTRVCDIEEAKLETLERCSVLPGNVRRRFSETNQVSLIVGLQIVRDSRDVELAQDLGLGGVLQTDDEQRVHSLKSDQVGPVTHEPGRVEHLAGRQSFESSDDVKTTI